MGLKDEGTLKLTLEKPSKKKIIVAIRMTLSESKLEYVDVFYVDYNFVEYAGTIGEGGKQGAYSGERLNLLEEFCSALECLSGEPMPIRLIDEVKVC